jgi:quercetin dioxygenase-like cupin family protein
MRHVKVDQVPALQLPGRKWVKLVGPDTGGCQNMVLGVVTFPPGSDPGPHRHEREEEIIYVIAGTGETRVGDQTLPLEPGIAVFTEPGVEHGVRNTGTEPLVLVSVFSPPVRPGSYDKRS